MYIKPIDLINEGIIEQEWDAVADSRDNLIKMGRDVSLLDVTEPFILESVSCDNIETVLDCGCGTGHLSNLIADKLDKKVLGIDISGKSIHIASKNYEQTENLSFQKSSIKHFAKQGNKYDACIANMVLMDIIDMKSNLKAIFDMIKPGGYFCFTITHPCFWPIYWDYFNEPWFDYCEEICIKAPFHINNSLVGHTTHIHRPLSKYISSCVQTGFRITELKELYPRSSHLELNYKYDYPRFLGFVCQKD